MIFIIIKNHYHYVSSIKGGIFIDRKVTEKTLESGKVLLCLKESFLNYPCEVSLGPLLSCLRDSKVFVPVNVTMSETDRSKFLNSKKGDVLTTSDVIKCKPDILRREDKFYFPMFSNYEQIPEEYGRGFSNVVLPVLQCIEMAKSYENVCGLVLDAFTLPLVLEYDIADLIPKFESKLDL